VHRCRAVYNQQKLQVILPKMSIFSYSPAKPTGKFTEIALNELIRRKQL
jgi:hypothetical protein